MSLTRKQQLFVDEYLKDFNATRAAIAAGYSEKTAANIGWENLRKPQIAEIIDQRVELYAVGKSERLQILADIARDADEMTKDRLKAVEMLGKLSGDYVQKIDVEAKLEATPIKYITENRG